MAQPDPRRRLKKSAFELFRSDAIARDQKLGLKVNPCSRSAWARYKEEFDQLSAGELSHYQALADTTASEAAVAGHHGGRKRKLAAAGTAAATLPPSCGSAAEPSSVPAQPQTHWQPRPMRITAAGDWVPLAETSALDHTMDVGSFNGELRVPGQTGRKLAAAYCAGTSNVASGVACGFPARLADASQCGSLCRSHASDGHLRLHAALLHRFAAIVNKCGSANKLPLLDVVLAFEARACESRSYKQTVYTQMYKRRNNRTNKRTNVQMRKYTYSTYGA